MKKQIEYLKKSIELSEQHPEMEVIIGVNRDEILDDFVWTRHKITSVEISLYYEQDEKIITDIDEMREDMENYLGREVTEPEAIKEMKEVILIRTGAN